MAGTGNGIVIVSAARTPVGSFNGALSGVPASYLGTVALKAAMARAKVEGGEVDEVILGQILTAGQGQNPARQAAINAGIPQESPAWGINQLCGSGLRAVALGMQQIAERRRQDRRRRRPGEHEPGAARGLPARRREDGRLVAGRYHDQGRPVGRLQRLPHGHHRRERRPPVADHPRRAGRVRGASQNKAEAAQEAGKFKDEIAPVTITTRKGDVMVDQDEYIKKGVTLDSVAEAEARLRQGRHGDRRQCLRHQ